MRFASAAVSTVDPLGCFRFQVSTLTLETLFPIITAGSAHGRGHPRNSQLLVKLSANAMGDMHFVVSHWEPTADTTLSGTI